MIANAPLSAQAINIFGDKRNKEAAEKLAKEQELQKIHVKKEDIEVIVSVQLHGIDRINHSNTFNFSISLHFSR